MAQCNVRKSIMALAWIEVSVVFILNQTIIRGWVQFSQARATIVHGRATCPRYIATNVSNSQDLKVSPIFGFASQVKFARHGLCVGFR